nr:putative ribonuclease H-like domain-containing protein [Tanacetum cinerariifolium]
FNWVYFLKPKDETTPILKEFIRQAENQFNHKVKTLRNDNGTELKNHDLIEFRGLKGIKREYSNARNPQQNGVAKRKNRTLIEAARTMLADSFLPTTFWSEAVSTACYVIDRVLVTKPQNKTSYKLLTGRQPIISYLRPFGCHVTILNTINQLGMFDRKSDSGFLVGYSLHSKAFRVYNLETKRVEENLHVNFLENKPNVARKGHAWMFDLDYLTNYMNYEPVSLKNQANKSAVPQQANISACTQANDDQGANSEEIDLHDEHFILPIWSAYSTSVKSSGDKIGKNENPEATHETQDVNTNNTNLLNAVSTPVSAIGPLRALNDDELSYLGDSLMPHFKDIYASPSTGIFTNSSYDDEGMVTDFNNLETTINVSPTPTTRIHTIHPKTQILRDPLSAVQTRSKVHKNFEAHALVSYIQKQQRNNHKDFQHCLFACFLSEVEPKKISQALEDESWADAMHEELLQNKKDERGVIVRNKFHNKLTLVHVHKLMMIKVQIKRKLIFMMNILYCLYGLLTQLLSRAQGTRLERMRSQLVKLNKSFRKSLTSSNDKKKEANDAARKEATHETQDVNTNSTNLLNAVSTPVSAIGPLRALNDDEPSYLGDSLMPHFKDIYASPSAWIFTNSSYDDEGVVTDFNNLETTINVSPTPTTRIHTIHPKTQILGYPLSAVQTRSKLHKNFEAHALVSYIQKQQRNNHKDFQHCLFACFLSEVEPKKISQALEEESWADAMHEELLQNKKDERGVIVRNKSAFLYGTIDEEAYVTQPPGFIDPKFPNKVYKVMKAIYGLHQAPRAWYATLSTFLERSGYRRGAIDKTLFIKQDKKGIMLVQVYVDDIIFGLTKKSGCDEFKELMKNRFQMSSVGELTFFLRLLFKQKEDGIFISQDKSMIGSLMYLTASRPDIMFTVCACSRF